MASVPPVAVTFFFFGASGYGWSERYWLNGTLDQTAQLTEIVNLLTGRCSILTDSCSVVRVRIQSSQVRNPLIYIPPGVGGTPGTETHPTAENEVALLALAQAPGVGYIRPFLRGIPSRIISGDNYAPDATFTNNFQAFANVLTDGQWYANGSLGNTGTPYPIQDLSPLPPRGVQFMALNMPPGSGRGANIRIHGAQIPGYNGIKRVVSITPPVPPAILSTVIVGGAAPPTGDTAPAPYITVENLFNGVLTSLQPLRISRRAAGRPFGQLRGRRQTLYSLRR